ncbi:MAG: PEP-CTERM sorting domain-containing protein [Thermodesulfobacteriota bacterium]
MKKPNPPGALNENARCIFQKTGNILAPSFHPAFRICEQKFRNYERSYLPVPQVLVYHIEIMKSLRVSPFLASGSNVIQVLAGDHGGATFFDLKLTGEVAPVPEPATMLLLGTGLAGLAGVARKRKRR